MRVVGEGNGLTGLEAIRQSRSQGVKRFLSDPALENESDTERDKRIRTILRDDLIDFVQDLLDELKQMARSGELTQFAVFADPQVMRIIRLSLPTSLLERLLFTHELTVTFLTESALQEIILRAIKERRMV